MQDFCRTEERCQSLRTVHEVFGELCLAISEVGLGLIGGGYINFCSILLLLLLSLHNLGLPRIVCLPSNVLIGRHSSPLQHYMENGQVAQEEQSAEVEEDCDENEHLELDKKYRFIDTFVGFNRWCCRCEQIVDYEDVRDVVDQGKEENGYDESEEELVVSLADAIIEPAAMMIEVVDAAIAGSTVLRCVVHMRFANVTFELEASTVEILSKKAKQ